MTKLRPQPNPVRPDDNVRPAFEGRSDPSKCGAPEGGACKVCAFNRTPDMHCLLYETCDRCHVDTGLCAAGLRFATGSSYRLED